MVLAKRNIIDEQIEQLLEWEVIELSSSPTAWTIVLIWKNDNWRFCVDLGPLNAITNGDSYHILRSNYVFSSLADKQFYTTLDEIKVYFQIKIDEADSQMTAFISHKCLYQWCRLAFVVKNAPAIYQRLMDQIQGGLIWTAVRYSLDDIIFFSDLWAEHRTHRRTILITVEASGLEFS